MSRSLRGVSGDPPVPSSGGRGHGARSVQDERREPMRSSMDRRSFMKITGAAATGLAGILESGRAPAYAQGTKLHLLRWTDFVPAADEVLAKQMPEASKA